MPLSRQQEQGLDDKVMHLARQFDGVLDALDDIKASHDELGADVAAFLAVYFTPTQWQTARNAVATLRNQLLGKIAAARGAALDALRPPPPDTGEGRDGGL